jgi:hypothetical protein
MKQAYNNAALSVQIKNKARHVIDCTWLIAKFSFHYFTVTFIWATFGGGIQCVRKWFSDFDFFITKTYFKLQNTYQLEKPIERVLWTVIYH